MLKTEQYHTEELTIDATKAQMLALIYVVPFIILFGVPYFLLWGHTITKTVLKNLLAEPGLWAIPLFLGVLLGGIVIHELIHGITWACFAPRGYKSIRYGVLWKSLTPYCHCQEPLKLKHYLIGGTMPGLILGILPALISLVTGSFTLFLFGLFFTVAAGGDFLMVAILRNESFDNLVQDHSSKIGCYIYKPIRE
ncbi:hypothetical protein AAE02nite_21460 [Adhaeribacter aerolatus]|uniref:Uncharacterized protein n=1 Tax=Adhaeribacter aerolatus TaxID=670289 RepID=A0A512AXN3_9BACT|nr:DUF3267 domain-containing protein [Adhaeribacter aerolatus]GEO04482.1 hypothetical protein AAE02nite_21460 [Adhaeribacter aerolatus]